eukprot:TRINITY_DN418_c0_g2_i1.p1 TRINITY_DN418_c0_g2~~TRINITY_DN418_c0_g2_i1.p1  ORF type:complete len:299 (-),score=18.40 TRINITY_DN418_c0_g2_i1:195-1091(-)
MSETNVNDSSKQDHMKVKKRKVSIGKDIIEKTPLVKSKSLENIPKQKATPNRFGNVDIFGLYVGMTAILVLLAIELSINPIQFYDVSAPEQRISYSYVKQCIEDAGVSVQSDDMARSAQSLYNSLTYSTLCNGRINSVIIIIGEEYDTLRKFAYCIQKLDKFKGKDIISSGLPYRTFQEKIRESLDETRDKSICPKGVIFVEIDQTDSSYLQEETNERTYRDIIEAAIDDSYPVFLPTSEPIRDNVFILLYKSFDSLVNDNETQVLTQDIKELRLREYVTRGWTQRFYHRLRNKVFLV